MKLYRDQIGKTRGVILLSWIEDHIMLCCYRRIILFNITTISVKNVIVITI